MNRIAVIDYDLCNPRSCDFLCSRLCPRNRAGEKCVAVIDKINGTPKRQVPQIDENLCIGCGICSHKCPYGAISVVNLPEKLAEMPVHRFGKNAFVLFRLPIPAKGVVGLLGPNGVGKTTALRILSGQMKPNLGKDRYNFNELKKLCRGTELQKYMEELENKNIKTVYKPQQVNLIPKLMRGKVDKILKADSEILKKLELESCLGKELKELSGGELQRVAIAEAAAKDADFYYFDEPSSYLDVRQRINVARLLQELSEKKYVMVVEHDLATLDMLADHIHIFYGQPGVYGIVSKPYAVRNGVNTFLSGYIKEDNVRMREKTVFETITYMKKQKKEIMLDFGSMNKKLGSFSLAVPEGRIYFNEILGAFGANGLGKTTFAKMLVEHEEIKISYKPQYLESHFRGRVSELLANVSGSENYKILSRQLDVERMMEKNVEKLSGGELQRIAILLCLSRDCDLYLLDEPSAYLDVDQRLAVAKAMKDAISNTAKSVIVIDHDLLFLSYVADRAMVFSGIPGISGTAVFMNVRDGFNKFLKEVGITFRRDPETKRPRANKPGSVQDREQKEKGEYFY
jgi:ATP-binding cassette subfamily E protein 1